MGGGGDVPPAEAVGDPDVDLRDLDMSTARHVEDGEIDGSRSLWTGLPRRDFLGGDDEARQVLLKGYEDPVTDVAAVGDDLHVLYGERLWVVEDALVV